jgi:hypothetical protein
MTADRTRQGLQILGLAILLGVLGDALLRSSPWGLNAALWVTALAAATIVVLRPDRNEVILWLLLALAFAAFVAWRDSPFLKFWNSVVVTASLTLVALRSRRVQLQITSIFKYLTSAVDVALSAAVGPVLLTFGDVRLDQMRENHPLKRSRSILIGVALAAPLVLIFGTLFVAADPVFEQIVNSVFDWDLASITSHASVACLAAWLAAGYLRTVAFTETSSLASVAEPRTPSLGIVEIAIALGTTILIFLLFVAVQIQYLFGGEQLVQATLGLSYAEYARRGFFELVSVAALVVPVLLAADWMLDKNSHKNRQSFTALATTLLLLVALVMVSALKRIQLYVDVYGLTGDRLYAAAFMLWIAAVLGWFAMTVLRGKRHRFAFGAIMAGFVVMLSLNALNPDATIARTNLARARAGESLDIQYLATLGADAAPVTLSRSSILPARDKCELIELMTGQRWATQSTDWRSWNLGRERARQLIKDYEYVNTECEASQAANGVITSW